MSIYKQAFLSGYLSKTAAFTTGDSFAQASKNLTKAKAPAKTTAKSMSSPTVNLAKVNTAQPSSAPVGAVTQQNKLLSPTNFNNAPSSTIASQTPPTSMTINTAGKGAPATPQVGMQQASNTNATAVANTAWKVAPMHPLTGVKTA